MKRYIYALSIALVSAVLYTSCLGSDSTTEVTVYDDMAITGFSLSKVNRYIHTTSKSGADSVYKKVMEKFPTFTIDQKQYKIYNTDSLPKDCDIKHILADISSSSYSGSILIKGISSDTLWIYSSTDSVDFSKTREIRVYNNTMEKYRAYEVTILQHQVETNQILWEKMPAEDYPGDEIREKWEEIVAEADLGPFIGVGTKEAYALSKDGTQIMVSRDEGATWEPDIIDGDAALLPKEQIAFVSFPFAPNDETDYQLMVGAMEEGEIACSVWRKIAEYADGSATSKWVNLPVESYNRYFLPATDSYSLVYFHDYILAISSNDIYASRDGGIVWRTSEFQLPKDGDNFFYHVEAVTDDEGALWFKDLDTNNVWRGVLVD